MERVVHFDRNNQWIAADPLLQSKPTLSKFAIIGYWA